MKKNIKGQARFKFFESKHRSIIDTKQTDDLGDKPLIKRSAIV